MNSSDPPVKVLFRVFQGEVLALFPELPGTNQLQTCSCYACIGQHSHADLARVMRASRPARPDEYAELACELQRLGYSLIPIQRVPRAARARRLAACLNP